VDAAQAADIPQLIQESIVMIYPDNGADLTDEDAPLDHYAMTKRNHAAEANARRFADAGGYATVLRFGFFYGPGAAHSEQILNLARHHIGFILGRPDAYTSSIHLADGADAIVAALTCAGGTYNIVDRRSPSHQTPIRPGMCARARNQTLGYRSGASSLTVR
jgi:nucleoside-diphosphate-sugar epimerase